MTAFSETASDRHCGLVVRASAYGAESHGFESHSILFLEILSPEILSLDILSRDTLSLEILSLEIRSPEIRSPVILSPEIFFPELHENPDPDSNRTNRMRQFKLKLVLYVGLRRTGARRRTPSLAELPLHSSQVQ